jgi:hypothetical protein
MHLHNWQFFLAESDNLEVISEITPECRDRSFSLSLNRPGTLSFNLPLQTSWYDFLTPWEHCVIAHKNKEAVWSGPIQQKVLNYGSNKIDIACVGWFELLNRRYIVDSNHTYTTTNEGQIAFELLDLANSLSLESETRPTGIVEGSNTSTTARTRTYERWANIGASIMELTEVEDGFDFEIDPLTREMNIREWSEYQDLTEVIWGFNWGPHNLKDFVETHDGDALKNDFYVVGQYGISHANDTDEGLDKYGVHQHIEQISELSDTDFGGAIANIEIATNKIPRVNLNISPRGGNDNMLVPGIFNDFNLGDKTYLTAKRGQAEILDQPVRIFGWNFNIDSIGNEEITQVQVTYSE